MAHKRTTPEEELLNLIEKGDDAKSQKTKKKKKFSLSFFKLFKLLPFGKGIEQAIKKIKKRKPGLSFGFANKLLIVTCSLIVCFSIWDFIFNRKDIEIFYDTISNIGHQEQKVKDAVKLRPFLHYLALVQRRNIFNPVRLIDDIDESKENRKALQDLLKDLVLVGISWGKQPQAMIENKKVNQTYFLKAGEVINNLKIESILKNKVILTYEGEKAELI